jgi:3D (Asp-Asp-Asp) domain-containing protein
MNSMYNKKGAILVITMILAYTCIVCLLQGVALNGCGASGHGPGEPRAGAELGGFTITAYCPGKCCNGEWAGLTASGKSIDYYRARNVRIAAVDPSVIPMGSRFTYRGREYHAVDIGGKIQGRRIDLLMPDHRAADDFGVKKDQAIVIMDSRAPAGKGAGEGEISRVYDKTVDISVHSVSGT